MKPAIFLVCVLSALTFAQAYYKQANPNTLPCTTSAMVDLSNKARKEITWMMGLINTKYPIASYPDSPVSSDTAAVLYYVQQARKSLTQTVWPTFKTLVSHDALNVPAGMHAHHMVTYDYFSHSGCCNNDPFQRMNQYASYSGQGENLWMSYSTPNYAAWTCEDVLRDLIVDVNVPSFGHRVNHYNNMWTHVGVGFGGGLSGSWEKYYVAFNFGTNPTGVNTALITTNSAWLGHFVQGVRCPNSQTFSGQSGTTIATCGTTTGATTTSAAPTTTTTTPKPTTSTPVTTTTAATTTTASGDTQISGTGTCFGNYYTQLTGFATSLRAQATSTASKDLLNRLKTSYAGFMSATATTTWTAQNIGGLTLSQRLSQWACSYSKAKVTGTALPAIPVASYAIYQINGLGIQSSLDYQTLALLQKGDNFYNSVFTHYGYAVYFSGTTANVISIVSTTA